MGRSPFECGRRDAAAAVLRQARQPRSKACNGESYGHESERGSESAVWNRLGIAGSRFGHGGSTGTLCWFDPQKNLSFVLLTTKPAAESQKTVLTPASDLVIKKDDEIIATPATISSRQSPGQHRQRRHRLPISTAAST